MTEIRIKLYKLLSKFPFNFSIFKTAKYICRYLEGKITCNELLSVCKVNDLKVLLKYLVEHGDDRFKEILANKPDLLRLPEYIHLWKEVILEHPENALEILEKVDFVDDAKIIKKSLEDGIVGLDLEVSLDGQSVEAGGIVFSSIDDGQMTSFYFGKNDIDKLIKFIRIISESNAILVGHNILRHDLKLISDIYNVDFKNRIIDTLYLQCLVEPGFRPRALSMLVPHTEHDPVEDAKASLILLKRLIEKIKQYNLEEEAKELLKDNPYVSGLPHVIERIGIKPTELEKSSRYSDRDNGKRKLLVVTDWKGVSNPWSPHVLDPTSYYSPKNVWEKAAVFSALCALHDPKCGFGDPDTFRKTWINDENTRRAILKVSKVVKKRELPKTSVETLLKYVPYLTDKFDEVILYDGELILSTVSDLSDFFRLSDKVLAYVSLADAFSEISKTINLDSITFADSKFRPLLLLPESSSLDPLNIASNVAGLLDHIELPAAVLVSNNYEKALVTKTFSNYHPTYVDDEKYGFSAFRLAIENRGIAVTDSFERIPPGFKSLIVFSDRSIIGNAKGSSWCERLAYSFMKIYGIARKINAEKIAYLSFSSGVLSDFLRIPEFGKILSHANKMIYKRKTPRSDMFVNVWSSVEEAVNYAEKITEEVWGFRYRPYQRRAVAMLMSAYSLGRSTSPFGIIILPTGAGKSVIFQSAAVALHKMTGAVTVVVSPLQALIQDQVDSLKRRGVRVAKLDSTVSSNERFRAVLDAISGNIELLYVTPERFERDELKVILSCGNVGFVILDEIHCLSTWGSTFRPSYKYMAKMIASEREKRFLPIYGFSATLPKDVLKDILNELNIDAVKEITLDFDSDFTSDDVLNFANNLILRGPATRPEIKIRIVQAKNDSDKLRRIIKIVRSLRDLLDKIGEPWIGLIFASFVKSSITHENVEYIAKMIEEGIGEEILYFHGQMSQFEKKEVISKLEKAVKSLSKPRIVVATKAFGMGVDLPNIRFVIHAHVSDSLEDYYQEIGRGGRDRKDCYAIAVFSPDDFDEKRRLIRSITYDHINRLINIIKDFKAIKSNSNEIAIPLNPFYSHFGYRDGRAILKKVLQILEENGIIDYEITNGIIVAYRLLDKVDLDNISDAIIYFDKVNNVLILDTNNPKMYKAILEEKIQKLEKDSKIERIEYTWTVGNKTISISKNGSKFEMGYIILKKSPRLEDISISKELEYYQLQIQKLSQLERFFKEISSLPLREQNEKAHKTLRMYLEEGIASEFERVLIERIKRIKTDIIDRLGDKAVIFGLMGSGKTEMLAKLATYYISKYSNKSVVVVLPDQKKCSDILSRIREYLGYDVTINIRSAKSINERCDELLKYEVIIFDDVDVAIAKSLIGIDSLERIAKFNRKVYLALDPIVVSTFGYFERVLDVFKDYNIAVLKSIVMPVDVKVNGFNVKVIQREICEPRRHRVPIQIVKYLPGKFDGALMPGIKFERNWEEYYRLLYLCLKASKYCSSDLKIEKDNKFEYILTEWLRILYKSNRNIIEIK